MNIREVKINNEVVKPIKTRLTEDSRPIKGGKLFDQVCPNVFLTARKNSGKSTLIKKIITSCIGRDTRVIVFCSTIHKDPIWLDIKRMCKKHNVRFLGLSGIKDGKIDQLSRIYRMLNAEQEVTDSESEPEEPEFEPERKGRGIPQVVPKLNLFAGRREEKEEESEDDFSDEQEFEDEKGEESLFGENSSVPLSEQRLFMKPRESMREKSKFRYPENLFIFDDISADLKLPSLVALTKSNRHSSSMCIYSSQYSLDLKPESIRNMDFILVFRGFDQEKVEKMRREADLPCTSEQLWAMYQRATRKPHSFLYIGTRNGEFRRNFDVRLEMQAIPQEETAESGKKKTV